MKLKRVVLVGLVLLMVGGVALSAQVSFLDQFSIGGAFDLNVSEKEDNSDDLFGDLHFIMDYWIGAYVQNIDSAIYGGLRWDIDTLEVGGMWDYHFTNMVGFSLGAGAELLGPDTYDDDRNRIEHQIMPYVRVGAFLHFMTMMKLGADFTYKLGGQPRIGLYLSVTSMSLFYRLPAYQSVRRTSNRNIIGRWNIGDTENGSEFYFGEDFTSEIVVYQDGSRTVAEGSWSTTDEGGLFGIQFIFVNVEGVTSKFVYKVDLEKDTLWVSTDGEAGLTLNRYVE